MDEARSERLAAWLDGELVGDAARAFEAEIAADPELAALVEQWQANDALIVSVYGPVSGQPIEPALLERMGLAPASGESSGAPPANDNWWSRYRLPLGGAIAAGLAAALIFAPSVSPSRHDPLSSALDQTPSLMQASLPDGRTITPTLTTRAADGRWCRAYVDGRIVALACRSGDGHWVTEAQAQGIGPSGNQDYDVAGAEEPQELKEAYSRLGAADAVDARTEAELIARKWRDAP